MYLAFEQLMRTECRVCFVGCISEGILVNAPIFGPQLEISTHAKLLIQIST